MYSSAPYSTRRGISDSRHATECGKVENVNNLTNTNSPREKCQQPYKNKQPVTQHSSILQCLRIK